MRDYNKRRQYEKLKKKQMEAEEKLLLKVIKKVFHEQRDELIEALGGKKNLFHEIFNERKEVERLKLALPPVLREIMIKGGNEAMAFAGAEPRFTATQIIESWISKRTEEVSEKVVETSYKELEQEFVESFSQGENRQQLIKRIEETYTNWDKVRATRIARTETHSAFQKATLEGYNQSGMEIKIWVATMQNTRDSHIANDGLERPMNVPFPNGQMFPGDTNAPPSEYMNCQCTI